VVVVVVVVVVVDDQACGLVKKKLVYQYNSFKSLDILSGNNNIGGYSIVLASHLCLIFSNKWLAHFISCFYAYFVSIC
jgi:hypothetical protein